MGAESWEKVTTEGMALALAHALMAAASAAPVYVTWLGSPSNLFSDSTASAPDATPYAVRTSSAVASAKGTSSLLPAASMMAFASSEVGDETMASTAESALAAHAAASAAVASVGAATPVRLRTHATMDASSRPPPYSVGLPPLNHFRVGKPWICGSRGGRGGGGWGGGGAHTRVSAA